MISRYDGCVVYAYDSVQLVSAESRAIRRIGFALALLAIPAFALLALAFGKEAGWDFQNYHWYDPYALLSGRLGFDIAVAHHATYYNPLPDVPLYWLGAHFPAWVAGAWLGVQAGLAAALLGAIAFRLIPLADRRARLAAAVLLALAGMGGGGALGDIGKTSGDIAGGLGFLAGLLVLASHFDRAVRARGPDLLAVLLPAGFLAGASPGLKLTAAPYAVGLTVALLALPGTPWRRLSRAGGFAIGVVLGIAVFGGFWLWTMWRFSGNPLFPYFNDIFHSPLVPPGSYRDPTFLPKDIWARLIFPFAFSVNSLLVAEWSFRDFHIAIAYVLVPLAAIVAWLGFRPPGKLVDPLAARMVLVTAAVTYVVWLFLFGIYRYLIPLEMAAPIVIAMAVALLPLSSGIRITSVLALLIAAQAAGSIGSEPRSSWDGQYVETQIPPIEDPDHTLILITGWAPVAYVIPEFPPEIPFLRIQGWLVGSQDRQSGFGAEMHRRVSDHQGPLYAMFAAVDRPSTIQALTDFGLALDDSHCAAVTSNIGDPLALCSLMRTTP